MMGGRKRVGKCPKCRTEKNAVFDRERASAERLTSWRVVTCLARFHSGSTDNFKLVGLGEAFLL